MKDSVEQNQETENIVSSQDEFDIDMPIENQIFVCKFDQKEGSSM